MSPANRLAGGARGAFGSQRGLDWLHTLLLVALLGLAAGRATLNEPAFNPDPLTEAGAYSPLPAADQLYAPAELMRVAGAAAVLVLASAWAIGSAIAGRLTLRWPLLAVLTATLGAALLASAHRATAGRSASVAGLEQFALLLGGLLAAQLADAPWRRRLALVVLAGLAVMLGAKGVYQVTTEIPEQWAAFQANRDAILLGQGLDPASPQAELYATRVREATAKGWFGLANPFGSLMVLTTLAAAGLAVDKWRRWFRADTATPAKPRSPGEIPLPLLAAILSSALLVVPILAWWWTGSTGARLAGLLAGLAAAGLYWKRDWAARHHRTLLGAAATLLLAGGVAVVGVGLARGGLPSRTLQVRWEYWRASAGILAEHPLLGVGPDNFASHYLRHRLPGAEEEVRNPHNVVVHALVEYGLPGGLAYLAILAAVLVLATRPRVQALPSIPPPGPLWRDPVLGASAAVLGLMLLWRLAMQDYPARAFGATLVWDNLLPAVGLAVGLGAAWLLSRPAGGPETGLGQAGRVALACGLGGFALHNLSDFALFQPGAAMVFWLAAGVVLAAVPGRVWHLPREASAMLAAVLTGVTILVLVLVAGPVYRKSHAIRQAALALSGSDLQAANRWLERATAADPLDPAPPASLAQLRLHAARLAPPATRATLLEAAAQAARTAHARDPLQLANLERLVQLGAYDLDPTLLAAQWTAPPPDLQAQRREVRIALQARPGDPRLLNRSAQLAYQAGDWAQAIEQLRRAIAATDDGWPKLWDHLGDAYLQAGDPQQAREAWLRLLASRLDQWREWKALARSGQLLLTELDPQGLRLRVRLAELAWEAGDTQMVLEQIAAARARDAALTPQSLLHLTAAEQARLDLLARKAQTVSQPDTP